MRLTTGTRSLRWALGAAGVGLAIVAAPGAAAEPIIPEDPGVPAPLAPAELAPAEPAAAPLIPAAAPVVPVSVTPPDGVSHLPSPDSLPPGTTTTQTAPEHPTLDYLKDVWNAIRTKEVSGSDALLLLAQRPVNNAKVFDSVPQSQSGPAAPPAAPPAVPASAEAPPVPVPAGAVPAEPPLLVPPAPAG